MHYTFKRESETGAPISVVGVGEKILVDGIVVALLNGYEDCCLPSGEPTQDFDDAIEEARNAGFWEQDYWMNHGYYFLRYEVVVEV